MKSRVSQKKRRTIDLLMLIVLLLLMAFQITGQSLHEWLGAAMLMLVLVHVTFNRRWYRSSLSGRYGLRRVLQTIVNFGLITAVLCLAFSGIVLSRHIFAALEIHGPLATARRMHMAAAYWGFVLMSVHLGLHWQMFIGTVRGRRKIVLPKSAVWLARGIAMLIATYGLVCFIQNDILTYMLLRTHFVFFDFNQGAFSVILEYLAMMGWWVFVSYYLCKALGVQKQVK